MTNNAADHMPPEASVEQRARRLAQRAVHVGKIVVDLMIATVKDWNRDNGRQLGAALAFYTALALAPLFVLLVVVAGQLFGDAASTGELATAISVIVGRDAAAVLETIIENANTSSSSAVATVISLGTLLFGASGVFAQLRIALNRVWSIEPKPGGGILRTVRDRALAFAVMLVAGTLLIAILMLDTIAGALNARFGAFVVGLPDLTEFVRILRTLQALKFFVLFGLFTPLFAFIFKAIPNAEVSWKDVWIGSAVTSLLFTLGNLLLGIYLRYTSIGSAYGAAGSLVVFLVLMYYYAQVFLLGAEFTEVYANRFGSRILPDEDAVRVVRERRSRQEIVELLDQEVEPDEEAEATPGISEPHPPAPPPAAEPPPVQPVDERSDE